MIPLMEYYIDQTGQFNRNAYNDAIYKDWYRQHGFPAPETENPEWMNANMDQSQFDVPAAQQAPQAPVYPNAPLGKFSPMIEQSAPPYMGGQQGFISQEQQDAYAQLAGQQQQQASAPQQAPASPVSNGARAALSTSRLSNEMDQEQRDRAMGHAMIGFMGNYVRSDNPSNLGSINESFNPALAAYTNERNRMLDENYRQQQYELQLQQEARASQSAQELSAYRKSKAGIGADGKELTQHQMFQQDKHKRSLIKDWHDVQKRKDLELNAWAKNSGLYGQKKLDAMEKKKKEIDKRYRIAEKNLVREGSKYGLDFEEQEEEIDNAVEQNLTPKSAVTPGDGVIPDVEKMSIEELQALGAK